MSKKGEALKLPDRRIVTSAGNPEDYINSGWNECLDAIREALAEQGCDYCNHPQYAGTKCKNCGREQPAQQDMPKLGCVNHDCDKCKAQQQQPVAVYVGETWCGSVVRLYEELPLETPLYTSPQSKSWVPLTEFDIDQIPYSCSHADSRLIAYAIEAKLKERNS